LSDKLRAVARKVKPIDPSVKELLGFEPDDDDTKVLKFWKAASRRVCKPCWELKYCPYGPLVEDSPLLPPLRDEAISHHEYLKECLATGVLGDGRPLDKKRREFFERDVAEFEPDDYPEHIPVEISDMGCRIFGHICPVVFNAEGFTETTEQRRTGRYIPTPVKMRVARRDNYTCQESGCGKVLPDFEIEFDHIIPVAKGGSSEEHNLRVMCFEHNRSKGARQVI
jgi:5-methylcytosine-specific restriction endonuclease McrA